ncbi:hypothetical protein BGZ73_000440 [Actinomortierella ambigua]|nr:hypothetical protein BGZ73_000440 [Actinomortierella ambigua]
MPDPSLNLSEGHVFQGKAASASTPVSTKDDTYNPLNPLGTNGSNSSNEPLASSNGNSTNGSVAPDANGSSSLGAAADFYIHQGFKIPIKPTPPGSEDCCMSGCAVCVYDVYEEDRQIYKERLANVLKQMEDAGVSPPPELASKQTHVASDGDEGGEDDDIDPSMKAFLDACCNTPPTDAQWKEKGTLKTLPNGRQVYRTGPKDAKRGIVAFYDIFAFHPTTYQFYDRLAEEKGFQVSMLHVFTSGGYPPEKLGNSKELMAWIGNYDYTECDLYGFAKAAVEDLRKDGVKTFAVMGQCWGVLMAAKVASEADTPFCAWGGPHPSFISGETVKNVKIPGILLPSKDEKDQDMIDAINELNSKNLAIKSVQHRFDNMFHGWTGGRGDWSDPEQKKEGERAMDLIADYFAKAAAVEEAKL